MNKSFLKNERAKAEAEKENIETEYKFELRMKILCHVENVENIEMLVSKCVKLGLEKPTLMYNVKTNDEVECVAKSFKLIAQDAGDGSKYVELKFNSCNIIVKTK